MDLSAIQRNMGGSRRIVIKGIVVNFRGPKWLSTRPEFRAARDRLIVEAWTVAGFAWHTRNRARHFTPEGAKKYHYSKRLTKEITKGKVKLIKRGRFKGTPRAPSGNPLEWSGRSKQLSARPRVKATKFGARVKYPIRAFNFKPPKNPTLDMVGEFRQTTTAETHQIKQDAVKWLRARLRRTSTQFTVTLQPR